MEYYKIALITFYCSSCNAEKNFTETFEKHGTQGTLAKGDGCTHFHLGFITNFIEGKYIVNIGCNKCHNHNEKVLIEFNNPLPEFEFDFQCICNNKIHLGGLLFEEDFKIETYDGPGVNTTGGSGPDIKTNKKIEKKAPPVKTYKIPRECDFKNQIPKEVLDYFKSQGRETFLLFNTQNGVKYPILVNKKDSILKILDILTEEYEDLKREGFCTIISNGRVINQMFKSAEACDLKDDDRLIMIANQ